MLGAGEGTYRHARVEVWSSGSGGDKAELHLPVRGLSILQISHGKHGTPRLFSFLGLLSIFLLDGKELYSIPSPIASASILVADRVIFPESETDPVILPLEALLFLPAGLKIRNIFPFFFSWLPRPL